MAGYNYQSKTPDEIKKATVYEALAMLELASSVHIKNQTLGIKSINFQGDSVSYGKKGNGGCLSPEAYTLIRKWTGAAKIVQ